MKKIEPSVEEIRQRLAAHRPLECARDGFKPAAVLVPIFAKDGSWHVLLTRRTEEVEAHKGEISFPGGHQDEDDPDPVFTALRETEEEVGIPPGAVKILGRLDDLLTITRFRIQPFVGLIAYPFAVRPAPAEIAEVIVLPLRDFLDPAVFSKREVDREGSVYPIYFFAVGGYTVWGATARILKQFLELCLGYQEPGEGNPGRSCSE